MRNTKKALLTSVLSLLLCFSMLVGTTFAWFTDEVSTLNNKIVAGNLDVELEYHDGNGWKQVEEKTNLFEVDTLWEPGHTEVIYLKISNLGSLALKYALNVNIASEIESINVDGKPFALSDYIYCDVIDGVTEPFASRDAALKAAENAAPIATRLKDAQQHRSGNLYPVGDATGVSEKYVCLVVYMPYTVGNEANYRTGEVTPEITLGVNLMATQLTHENDSFDDQYDANAKFDGVPPFANVIIDQNNVGTDLTWNSLSPAQGEKLDVSYIFNTTETYDEAQLNAYRFWHADFVVTFDKDITAADGVGIAGNYGSYDWIGFNLDKALIEELGYADGTLPAGTPIRLLKTAGIYMNYEELCLLVKTFMCGAWADTYGYSIDVSLNLYETTVDPTLGTGDKNVEVSPENRVTIGTYTYEFTDVLDTQEEFEHALATGATDIKLADGEYTTNIEIPGGSNITITGSGKDTVLSGQIASTSSTAGTITLKDLTINVDDTIADSTGISQTSKSAIALWGNQSVICENVTFNMSLANSTAITSWWDTNEGTSITVRNCTFNCNGQRPIRATGNVTVENCTFNDPYRYAVQLTAKASTATLLDKAIINFNNNTIVNGANGKDFVYGIQLEGADYGCHDCVINGTGNTIVNGGTESTMYYCECGKVDHATIEWHVEVDPVHEG